MNLTICLLVAPRFITKAEIRDSVSGYSDLTAENFDRTFERDKTELRQRGIPIETGTNDSQFGDEVGYRIPRAEFEMPTIDLTQEEATAVAIASRLWQQHTLADPTRMALGKLRAIGAQPLTERMDLIQLPEGGIDAGADPQVLDAFVDAFSSRSRIRFTYHDTQRTFETWSVSTRGHAWYVTGVDTGKGERRSFRLDRVQGAATLVGAPGAYEIPEDFDAEEFLSSLHPQGRRFPAVLAIRGEEAPALRRLGTPRPDEEPVPGFRVFDVELDDGRDIVGDIAAAADGVIVLEPPTLRQQVIDHLQAIAQEGH